MVLGFLFWCGETKARLTCLLFTLKEVSLFPTLKMPYNPTVFCDKYGLFLFVGRLLFNCVDKFLVHISQVCQVNVFALSHMSWLSY